MVEAFVRNAHSAFIRPEDASPEKYYRAVPPIKDELEWHTLVKKHSIEFIKRLAAEDAHAILFTDTSARPMSWLFRRLWSHVTDKPIPVFYFMSANRSYLDANKTRAMNLAKKFKLSNKKVIVFDEHCMYGDTLHSIKTGLALDNVEVVTAAFNDESGRAQIKAYYSSAFHSPWSYYYPSILDKSHEMFSKLPQDKPYHSIFRMHPIRAEQITKYRNALREGMYKLADEIISEMKVKKHG